jgi:hypothetical protein
LSNTEAAEVISHAGNHLVRVCCTPSDESNCPFAIQTHQQILGEQLRNRDPPICADRHEATAVADRHPITTNPRPATILLARRVKLPLTELLQTGTPIGSVVTKHRLRREFIGQYPCVPFLISQATRN